MTDLHVFHFWKERLFKCIYCTTQQISHESRGTMFYSQDRVSNYMVSEIDAGHALQSIATNNNHVIC